MSATAPDTADTTAARGPGRRSFRVLGGLAAAALLLTLLFAAAHELLARRSGLVALDPKSGAPQAAPASERLDRIPTSDTVRRQARLSGGGRFSGEWRSVLIPPAADRYRFLVEADDRAVIVIDRRVVATHGMPAGSGAIALERRQYELLIRYEDDGGQQRLEISWARGDGQFRPIPMLLTVPHRVSRREADARRVIHRAALLVPVTWLAVLGLALVAGLRAVEARMNGPVGRPRTPELTAVLAAAGVLFTAGVWWGAPGSASWAPDEIGPSDVRTALLSGFAGGWASIYPPLHHAVIALVHLPFEAAFAAGLGDPEDVVWAGALLLAGRAVSILMALGIVWTVHRVALEQFGRRAALCAAACSLAILPLAFYAKTVNPDVPYVFWLGLSFLFLARMCGRAAPRPADFYLFSLFATLAVCTKDQAYGFYVLPAAYLIGGSLLRLDATSRGRPAVPARRVLAGMAAIAVLGFAVCHNLPLNSSGFAEHLRLIVGPGSEGYRVFENTPVGHARMAVAAFRVLGQSFSWPIFGMVLASVVAAFLLRQQTVLWLLLPAVSYYLTFIAVVGYHYDRFFLGVGLVLAIAAGWGVDRFLQSPHAGRLKQAGFAAAVAYALARAAALDVMMVGDARYGVERWLRAHIAPEHRVAAIGYDALLPRKSAVPWKAQRPVESLLRDEAPHVLVVNVAFARRADPGSQAETFYAGLERGTVGYRRIGRFRGPVVFPLSLEPRFRQPGDDPSSNLTKVNPAIDVYVRSDVRLNPPADASRPGQPE